MNQLDRKGLWHFRAKGYIFFLFLSVFPLIIILTLLFTSTEDKGLFGFLLAIILIIILLYLLIAIGMTELYAKMSFNRWLYDLTPDGIRLEKGIIWKKYSNIPYARIQNVEITRGIIARIFGFSSLQIQTAGYSAMPYAEGSIPALSVDEAEKIRELLMKKVSGNKK